MAEISIFNENPVYDHNQQVWRISDKPHIKSRKFIPKNFKREINENTDNPGRRLCHIVDFDQIHKITPDRDYTVVSANLLATDNTQNKNSKVRKCLICFFSHQ